MINSCRYFNRVVFCTLGLILAILPGIVSAQSRVISVNGSGNSETGSRVIGGPSSPAANETVTPSSFSATQTNWERTLNKPHQTPFDDQTEYDFLSVLDWLQSLDLPIALDQSAKDDSLTEDDPFVLEMPGQPLVTRLNHSLKEKNATLAMYPDHVAIVSMDVERDPDYFLSEFYPVAYVGVDNYEDLVDDIVQSVDPEVWYDNGGDASISYLVVNGQPTISLYAPYSTHRQLRNYLANLQRIGAQGVGRQLVTSQIIRVPAPREKRKVKRKKGHGIGGFGGGGGVF